MRTIIPVSEVFHKTCKPFNSCVLNGYPGEVTQITPGKQTDLFVSVDAVGGLLLSQVSKKSEAECNIAAGDLD